MTARSIFVVVAWSVLAACSSNKKECEALNAAVDEADNAATVLIVEGITKKSEVTKHAEEIEAASKKLGAIELSSSELKTIRDKRKKHLDEMASTFREVKGAPDEDVTKEETDKLDAAHDKDMGALLEIAGDLGVACK